MILQGRVFESLRVFERAFDSSLTSNTKYAERMKNDIFETRMLDQDNVTDKQLRWKFLKYEIQKFTFQKLYEIQIILS